MLNNMYENDIGGILKYSRISLGFTLKEVSDKTKLSPSTIKNYEDDKVKVKLINILKLIDFYKLELSDFNIKIERINNDSIKNIYTLNNQIVYELTDNNSSNRKYINKDEYIVDGNNEERIIENLYKTRIWNRHIKLGFNKEDIISLNKYSNLIINNCYYCGTKPNQIEEKFGTSFKHNGIDRLDSSKGYILGNVVPCCSKCNLAKGLLSEKEFLSLIEDIYINQKINKKNFL